MRKRGLCRRIAYCVFAIAVFSVTFIMSVTPASAISNDELTKKALLNSLKTCGTTTYFKASINQNSYSKLDNLFTSAGNSDGKIRVPTMVGTTIKDGDLSCKQVLAGYHKNGQDIKGLTEYSGKAITKDNLTSIGYRTAGTAGASSVTQECIQITYEYEYHKLFGGTEWKTGETTKYCFWVADGVINTTPSGDHNVTTSSRSWHESNGDVTLSSNYDRGYWLMLYIIDGNGSGKNKSILSANAGEGDRRWADFQASFDNAAASINNTDGYRNAKVVFSKGTDTPPESSTTSSTALQFGGASSKLALLQFFAGSGASWDSVKFTESDKTTLLRAYVQQELDSGEVKKGTCDTLKKTIDNQGDKEIYVYRPDLSKNEYCILEDADKVTKKFNAPRNGMDLLYPESFLTIVTALMPQEIADKNKEIRHPVQEEPDSSDNEQGSQCSTAGGSLSWIICPIVEKLGEAIDGIYKDIESQYLQVNPEFLTRTAKIATDSGSIEDTKREDLDGKKTEDSGAYEGWKVFQNLANIVFAIVLAVIILSQITGFGVSNYGIKKMLPSLIVVAVLVNISFFLCQLAVDISNIIGYGIKDLFENINIDTRGIPANTGPLAYGIVEGLLAPAGAAVGITVLAFNWDVWIIPFLLLLLTTAISIIFFFILLGIRLAGIVVLSVLSPVAIICYALPNTKKIFERWWKLFFGLLMVYPICGILMGGGIFASKLLLSMRSDSTGYFYAFVAILIQVVPFFFVPSVVKSSFAALGNIGTKLSNFGRNLGNSTSKGIKRTEAYKDRQGRMMAHNANRKLNPWYNKNNRFSRVVGAPMRGISKAGEKARSWNNPVSRMAANTHNRKQNRLQGAVLAQNLANRDRSQAFAQRHMNELAKDYDDAWSNSGIFADEEVTAGKLEEALNDLRSDASNVDAQARFSAAMRKLNTSDNGRALVYSTINKAERDLAQGGALRNAGVKWAAGAVMNEAGGEYKAKSPAAFKNLGELAADKRDFDASKIRADSRGMYINTDYQKYKADDIGAEQLANTDDIYRRGAIQGLSDGTIAGDERNNLIAQAREAIDNQNISVKGDVERDLQQIANMNYAPPTGSTSSNSSVNTVDGGSVRRMASANQSEIDRIVRGVENGSIRNDAERGINDRTEIANVAEATLNAANAGTVSLSQETADKLNRIRALDGRSEIRYAAPSVGNGGASDSGSIQVPRNAPPIPDSFEQSGNSPIIVPRDGHSGDMTGSQIRDFERQMRRHNNGRNNSNNGGGGINLP